MTYIKITQKKRRVHCLVSETRNAVTLKPADGYLVEYGDRPDIRVVLHRRNDSSDDRWKLTDRISGCSLAEGKTKQETVKLLGDRLKRHSAERIRKLQFDQLADLWVKFYNTEPRIGKAIEEQGRWIDDSSVETADLPTLTETYSNTA